MWSTNKVVVVVVIVLQQQEEKRNKLNLYILYLGTLKKRDEEETGCYNDFPGIKRVSLLLLLLLLLLLVLFFINFLMLFIIVISSVLDSHFSTILFRTQEECT